MTKLLVGIGGIIVVVLIGVLIILDKDPSAYVGSLGAIVTTLVVNGIVGRRVEQVAKNVNGNTSKLLDERAELLKALETERASKSTRNADEYYPSLLSEDTVERIRADKDKLPSHAAE